MRQQGRNRTTQQAGGGLITSKQDQQAHGYQLILSQLALLVFCLHHARDDIVGRRPATLFNLFAQIRSQMIGTIPRPLIFVGYASGGAYRQAQTIRPPLCQSPHAQAPTYP